METVEILGAAFALLATLGIGTVAHEMTHAFVLRALGIPYDVEWFPARGTDTSLTLGIFGTWATVTPRSIPQEVPTWGLKLSAVAPLLLVTPLLLVFVGVLPDPVETDSAPVVAVTVAWLGCALPSPQDFSLFWHTDQAIDEHVEGNPTGE